ncbi:alpha/beta hydrolase [Streptococcus sp. H31]|uniref:alpha/beta hydrolase n=1 Tax=Streptococcus huangxiaojuni TaxID=3237239 RepID=UPI0034A4DF52
MFTEETTLQEIYETAEFAGFAQRLFPLDLNMSPQMTLAQASYALPWYGHSAKASRTVSIMNELRSRAQEGQTVFYEIYSFEEQQADVSKKRTGLLFFKGRPHAGTAIVNAGGAFQFVGGLQDSFPHCQYLAAQGYNAFALIYRPGAKTGRKDLARAIAFLHEHAKELGLDMTGYSLWGGSAGARLAAWLGNDANNGGEKSYPKAGAVIMQYTGFNQVTGQEPPTMALVGSRDWIADYRIMQKRIDTIKANGTPAVCKVYEGLEHGFGLGEGTKAEGWIDDAIAFWEENKRK